MKRSRFYWECIKRATSGGYRIAEAVGFIFAIVGGALAYFIPQLLQPVSILLWAVPLAVLVGVFSVGLVLAPHSLYQDLEKERDELRGELRAGQSQRDIGDSLGVFSVQGHRFFNEKVTSEDDLAKWIRGWVAWTKRVADFILENLTTADAAIFDDVAGLRDRGYVNSYNSNHNGKLIVLKKQLENLRIIMERIIGS